MHSMTLLVVERLLQCMNLSFSEYPWELAMHSR